MAFPPSFFKAFGPLPKLDGPPRGSSNHVQRAVGANVCAPKRTAVTAVQLARPRLFSERGDLRIADTTKCPCDLDRWRKYFDRATFRENRDSPGFHFLGGFGEYLGGFS